MKKSLVFGTLSILFATTVAHAIKLDNKKRTYWTIEFKKPGEFLLSKNFVLFVKGEKDDALLYPGEIAKISRGDTYNLQTFLFTTGMFSTTIRRNVPLIPKAKKKIKSKQHYITIKLVPDWKKLWLEPKISAKIHKSNDKLEQDAIKRLKDMNAKYNKRFKGRGCSTKKGCTMMHELQRKIKNLKK